MTLAQEHSDQYKKLYLQLKEGGYLQDARKNMARMNNRHDDSDDDDDEFDDQDNSHNNSTNPFQRSFETSGSGARPRGVESVASLSSGIAQHARSLVGSFACNGINDRTGGVLRTEIDEEQRQDENRRSQRKKFSGASENHRHGRGGRHHSQQRSVDDF